MKLIRNIIIFSLILIFGISNFSYATNSFGYPIDKVISSNEDSALMTKTKTVMQSTLYIILKIAQYVSVGCILIIGIKYIISTTSEKAEIKKNLLYYLFAFILTFAASSIASLIYKAVNS